MPAHAPFRMTSDTKPFDYYARLRATSPVVWDDSEGAWLVAGYEACKDVAKDEELFRHAYLDIDAETYIEIEGGPRNLLFLHGEEHAGLHRALIHLLSSRVVKQWRRTLIRPILDSLLEPLRAPGRAELVADIAKKLPIRVIAAAMDLPWRSDDWIKACKNDMDAIARFLESNSTEDSQITQEAKAASHRLNEALMPFIQERAAATEDDLISQLWRAGRQVLPDWDEIDMRANLRTLFLGGTDTTSHLLSNAFYLLAKDPALQSRIRDEGQAVTYPFVEEVLRLYGAAHFRPRTAAADTNLHGADIKEGDLLLVLNQAASRDEEHYDSPNSMELDRNRPQDHLAFFFGVRACVGASLARAEAQEAVAMVCDRLPDLRIDENGESPQFRGFFLRSYDPVPVEFG